MTLTIGLTGGIGSGKSTVANLFAAKNISVIDTDQISRDVVKPNQAALEQIVKKFGQGILLANGTLDRGKLRGIIFADEEKRLWLEKLLHPLIQAETNKRIRSSASPYCIVVIPLLFESMSNPLIQRALVVDCPVEQQVTRAQKRDNSTPDEIKAIINTQVTREKRLQLANDVITNNGSLTDLAPQVDRLHELYLSLSNRKS